MIVKNQTFAPMPLKYFLCLLALFFAIAATFLMFWLTGAATGTGGNPTNAISLTTGINSGILGPGQHRWFRMIASHQLNDDIVEKSLSLSFTPINNNVTPQVTLLLFTEDQVQTILDDGQTIHFAMGQLTSNDDDPHIGELFWQGYLYNNKTYYIKLSNDSDFPLNYQLIATAVPAMPPLNPDPEIKTPPQLAVAPQPQTGVDAGMAFSLNNEVNNEINTGHLLPTETVWYTFNGTDFSDGVIFQELSFSFFFTPADGNSRHAVNFELFTAQEIGTWWQEHKAKPNNFGAGTLVSRDGDFYTGERIWHGNIIRDNTYYVAVQNDSDVEIDYWLVADDLNTLPIDSSATNTIVIADPVFTAGASPQTANPLASDKNVGQLMPAQEIWYSFSGSDANHEAFQEMALTMIVTPDDGNRIQHVPFEVFTAQGVQAWSPNNPNGIYNVGAGSIVHRDNNDLTGERFWSGWIVDHDLYYVRIQNGADMPIDYWLFNGDVYGPELGP